MRHLLTRLLRRQEGVAMPVVLGALLVTSGLAAGTYAVSVEGTHSSARDRDSKAALAAAEAGLQMAFLQLSEVKPNDGQCVTTAAVMPVEGECPHHEAAMGNGATYRYVVATPATGSCAALPGKPTSPKDRCITSTGVVNGVARRLQTRVLYTPPFKPFANAGLVARDNVVIRSNETRVYSTIGTNGNVSVTHGATVNGEVQLGTSDSTWTFSNGGGMAGGGQPTYVAAPFEFADVETLFAASRSTNNNSALSSAYYSSGGRSFSMGNNTSYTIPAGVYNFCSFTMAQGAKLRVPAGQVVQIFVDSPARGGAGCPAGSGTYTQGNATEVNREYGANPAQLDLFVYGKVGDHLDPEDSKHDSPSIVIGNEASLYAGVYAPNATLSLPNGGTLIGAATVRNARIENNADFIWDERVLDKVIPNTGKIDELGWFECRREPTVPGDPESGCG